jgi:L-2-hydroxyglutarate oxidase LhgO
VIHSGIYYPKDSNKTKWCIEGRKLLYDFCHQYDVPNRKTCKVVVATLPEEVAYLEKLKKHCDEVQVPATKISKSEINEKEPLISVLEGVYLPETGIVNSHVYMERHEKILLEQGGYLVYNHKLQRVEKNNEFTSFIQDPDGNPLEISSNIIINCAGLGAAAISNQVLNTQKYEHRFCRGRYFSLASKYNQKFAHLIYPVPPKDGLGIHITVDMDGYARLGPDVDWCQSHDYKNVNQYYDCDWDSLVTPFTNAVKRYLPQLTENEISPGLIGIRPKLFIDNVAKPDFLIENFDGYVHCLGIESPGLTSSLAIADYVEKLL